MRTPWHVWVVGIVATLWNGGGIYDYLMTQLNVESYMSMLTEPQRAYMALRPVWMDAGWAVGVWGALAGSLLILLRSAWAGVAFLAAILGMIVTMIWSWGISSALLHRGDGGLDPVVRAGGCWPVWCC